MEAPLADGLAREIVIVDDASVDGSREIVQGLPPGIRK